MTGLSIKPRRAPQPEATLRPATLADVAAMETLMAPSLGLNEVFGLTRKPLFFMRLGFRVAEKEQFPLKVWADCARCPRQHACDEVAVALAL